MTNVFMLKILGGLFYLIVATCAAYGLWNLFHAYKTINSTVIRTHIIAYELQKMVRGRARQF